MKLETTGNISYMGPDDPTGDYYYIHTDDNKFIRFGVDSEAWGGDIYKGIPQLPSFPFGCKAKRCKITIEVLED